MGFTGPAEGGGSEAWKLSLKRSWEGREAEVPCGEWTLGMGRFCHGGHEM